MKQKISTVRAVRACANIGKMTTVTLGYGTFFGELCLIMVVFAKDSSCPELLQKN